MECIVPFRSCWDQLPDPEPGVVFLLVEYLPSSETLYEGEQVKEFVKKLRKLVTKSTDLSLLQYQSIIELFIFPWTWMSETLPWAI